MDTIEDWVEAIVPADYALEETFKKGQIGALLVEDNVWENADIVLLGCGENRGHTQNNQWDAVDAIRKKFYAMYFWHAPLKIADAGNVKWGLRPQDSYASLALVLKELMDAGKKVIVFGGSHDNTLGIYRAFLQRQQLVEATIVDALLDIDYENPSSASSFLMEMLTSTPNFIKHINFLGFQTYFNDPALLQTIDNLKFDCYRVGKVQENLEEIEPLIRSSHFVSFDINALAHAYAPVHKKSPNGFTGQEGCRLMQFAGMSSNLQVAGIFGVGDDDAMGITAMQLAQMLWYFIDGEHKAIGERELTDRSGFIEYHTFCAEVETLFLQSKHTGRWWVQLPDGSFVACSYKDYWAASHNDLPERWLRVQERM